MTDDLTRDAENRLRAHVDVLRQHDGITDHFVTIAASDVDAVLAELDQLRYALADTHVLTADALGADIAYSPWIGS